MYQDSHNERNIQLERRKVNTNNNSRNNIDSFQRENFKSPNHFACRNIRDTTFHEHGKDREVGEHEEEGEVQELGNAQEKATRSESNFSGKCNNRTSPKVGSGRD